MTVITNELNNFQNYNFAGNLNKTVKKLNKFFNIFILKKNIIKFIRGLQKI
jgi:hypothetical protein